MGVQLYIQKAIRKNYFLVEKFPNSSSNITIQSVLHTVDPCLAMNRTLKPDLILQMPALTPIESCSRTSILQTQNQQNFTVKLNIIDPSSSTKRTLQSDFNSVDPSSSTKRTLQPDLNSVDSNSSTNRILQPDFNIVDPSQKNLTVRLQYCRPQLKHKQNLIARPQYCRSMFSTNRSLQPDFFSIVDPSSSITRILQPFLISTPDTFLILSAKLGQD